jgi:nucleotide-binding universal stress UspA family protein
MVKVLLPVDGSKSAVRATKALVKTLAWYKSGPRIDLLAVHLPVPRLHNMGLVVSKRMLERYYAEEAAAMLAPSKKILDAAKVKYTVHTAVGPIAETIVDEAKRCDSEMIYMGTRGMTGLASMVLGSVATRVLHLADIPVVLIR